MSQRLLKLRSRPALFDVFRDRPPTYHVQAWYDEVRYYSYPYSQECDPHCPFRCSGPVCTHYTQVSGVCNRPWPTGADRACPCPLLVFHGQLVWATSSRIGCAINVCYNMNVWGMIWAKAVYLVCNYSPPYVCLRPSTTALNLSQCLSLGWRV